MQVWKSVTLSAMIWLIIVGVMQYVMGKPLVHTDVHISFYVQTVLTLFVIVAVPWSLWYVRRDRFPDEETYNRKTVQRYALLEALVMACGLFHLFFRSNSVFILGVIVLIGLIFARDEKTDTDSDRA